MSLGKVSVSRFQVIWMISFVLTEYCSEFQENVRVAVLSIVFSGIHIFFIVLCRRADATFLK